MASIVTSVLNVTVGWLVTKGRDAAAKKLKEGDVTDEQFRSMIVREIDDIKSKLDGLARKDLLTSISFFKEGIVFLYKILDKKGFVEESTAKAQAAAKTISLVTGKGNLLLSDLDDAGMRALFDAKKRFDNARMKATEAFNNVALSTSDRILAMEYRVMSTILEKIDNPMEAIAACKLCLEELHSMPAVVKSFYVQNTGGFWSMFKKDERREITDSVRDLNRVVGRVTELVFGGVLSREFDTWPCVNIEGIRINPIDEDKLETWSFSFGDVGEGRQKLDRPQSITTNTQGDFIIAEYEYIKVFNQNGIFLNSFRPDGFHSEAYPINDVFSDHLDEFYVLCPSRVYVINRKAPKRHMFNLRNAVEGISLTVNYNQTVFVLVRDKDSNCYTVHVYDAEGHFENSFGRGQNWRQPNCITTNDDDVITVLDRTPTAGYIYLFDAQGHHRHTITCGIFEAMAFHLSTEHQIFAKMSNSSLRIVVSTKHGDFVRFVNIGADGLESIIGITVTVEGRIAVLGSTRRTGTVPQNHVVYVV